jgi:hypothetical protein
VYAKAMPIVTGNLLIFNNNEVIIDTNKTQVQTTGDLKSKVKYSARDSMRFEVLSQKLYLFGDAKVEFEDIALTAGYVELDLKNNYVIAGGAIDSTGKIGYKPVLKQEEEDITADTIKYDIKNKKGLMKNISTVQGDGYITSETAKRDSNNIYYIKNGKYSTCNLEHPHFYINMTRMKVIPDDKIVTGPAYLVLGNVPTPLAIPFGFFPNKRGRSSGILIPSYGESPELGFYLRDGGYYLGISDYFDLALKGDIYSKGSYGLKSISNYNRKYKYSGNVALGYSRFRFGEPEFADFRVRNDFNLRWIHNQDAKAKPGVRFSANVNILSSSYNQLNSYNTTDYLSNTFQSNVAWSKSWKNFNLSTNFRHSQNTLTRKVDLSLPQVAFSMNRLYPSKLLNKSGIQKNKWYDKIGVSYNSDFENRISILDSNLFRPESIDSIKLGLRHSIPINAAFNAGMFNINPNFTFNSLWYFNNIRKQYDGNDVLQTDTIKDFRIANSFTTGISATTKLYGFYTYKNARIKAIRHVLTPIAGFAFRPDFFNQKYGYTDTIYQSNSTAPYTYSIFEQGIYGAPPVGKQMSLNFGIDNNLEMKLRPGKKDTTEKDKKIVLVESFSVFSSYNYAASVFNLAPFNLNMRTKLYKSLITFVGSAILDPYKISDLGKRYDKFVWEDKFSLGRLTSANGAISATLRSKNKSKPDKTKRDDKAYNQEYEYVMSHPEYYVDFNIPWTLSFSYNLRYAKPDTLANITQALTFNGDVNLTQKWKIGFNSGYDFVKQDFTYTSVNIYRDLHCWEMSFNWVPFGFRKSYTININVKSSVLQDLKLTRKRDWYDYQ